MIIYISFVSLSLLLFYIAYSQYLKKENAMGFSYNEPQPFFFGLGCLFIILLFALRGRTGTDTLRYNSIFMEMGNLSLKESLSLGQDRLFYLLTWIIYRISSGSIVFYNFVIGCVAFIPVLNVYKKYSNNFVLAFLYYIITGAYFFSFNGQRQGVAIAITFAGFSFLANKKYIAYIILIIFASMFHSSALIILPFGLMISKKTESKAFVAFCGGILLSTIFLWKLWNRIFNVFDLLGRDKIVNSYSMLTEEATMGTGVNILRVLVYVLPTVLGIIYYKYLQERNPYFYIILNYNIVSALLMGAATRTWYIARLAYYFNVATPLLLIELVDIVTENSKKLFSCIIIILYMIYLWFSLHMESNLLPYYFTVNNYVRVFN